MQTQDDYDYYDIWEHGWYCLQWGGPSPREITITGLYDVSAWSGWYFVDRCRFRQGKRPHIHVEPSHLSAIVDALKIWGVGMIEVRLNGELYGTFGGERE